MAKQTEVVNNTDKKRFELPLGEEIAVIEYLKVGTTYILNHTEVPESAEGKGIGSRLASGALDLVRDEGATVAPLCPFMKAYIQRHSEYQDLIKLRSAG